MNNSKTLRIRRYLVSPETPRSMKLIFNPREAHKSLMLSPVRNLLKTDPFADLETKDKPKLKPVQLKSNKKCITNQAGSSISIKLPSSRQLEFKKMQNYSLLPCLQNDLLTPKKSLNHCFSQINNLKLVEARVEGFKKRLEGGGGGGAAMHSKKVSFAEKNLDFSFGDEKLCFSSRGKN